MTPYFRHLKAVLLAVLIVIGMGLHHDRANAETLTVAGGCFWCVESDFESVPGVSEVITGYTGGNLENPTYKDVGRGGTGHYEAVQITYDPTIVSVEKLLALFFRSVDPTDAGGQFCDRGDSYRTAVFYSNPMDKKIAEKVLQQAQDDLGQKIVTPILPGQVFYQAEDYHQNYYKGTKLVLTRFGPKRQSSAYKRYREACGRDARVRQLWGEAAAFALTH